MDNARFDAWTRRRFGLAVGGFAATVIGLAGIEDAQTKKKRKKLKRNAFGCVNVGDKCRGKDSVCCSGICHGKKPKKGKKDKSRCVAHDASTCQPGQSLEECGGEDESCTPSNGGAGVCATTTGSAGYCLKIIVGVGPPCARDADCQSADPQGACILCPGLDTTRCARLF